ncbi:hypothetical protein CHELA20_53966 [Hyphomicrobiales bacterium]|nr:hypothetical protein CHELA41_20960 [Hyphomicrobiales bacterium]CAH1685320.1 hypothetical protein CHELA20_53966 [Hyphomicrobiales bacterium]
MIWHSLAQVSPRRFGYPRVTCVNYARLGDAALRFAATIRNDAVIEAAPMSHDERRSAGVVAALRRFPAERRAIDDLAAHNEDFRDMCEELAEAEMALLAADVLPPGVREERRAEWMAVIDRISAEIAGVLNEANVIRIGWADHLRRRP